MVILYFVRWFNIILVLRFLFQPGRLCTKLGFFVYYYLPYCYLHQTQENENVRTIKEGKIILKIALRIWSYVLDFLLSNPIVWSYIFRRISDFYIYHHVVIGILMVFSQCIVAIILYINYIIHYSDILYFIKLLYTIIVSL